MCCDVVNCGAYRCDVKGVVDEDVDRSVICLWSSCLPTLALLVVSVFGLLGFCMSTRFGVGALECDAVFLWWWVGVVVFVVVVGVVVVVAFLGLTAASSLLLCLFGWGCGCGIRLDGEQQFLGACCGCWHCCTVVAQGVLDVADEVAG